MNDKMKIGFFGAVLFLFAVNLQAQDNSKPLKNPPPSDAVTGYTYDFDKTQSLIIERIITPKTTNADVQVFLDQPDFPLLAKGKSIDDVYKDKLRVWMEKNPNLILNTLKNRSDIVHPF